MTPTSREDRLLRRLEDQQYLEAVSLDEGGYMIRTQWGYHVVRELDRGEGHGRKPDPEA
jgi:hypothetical protein